MAEESGRTVMVEAPISASQTELDSLSSSRVAVVHDWLPVYAGAERVLEQILSVVGKADVFSLIDFLSEDEREFLGDAQVRTSFIQHLPFARTKYRYYLPLAPLAVEEFNLGKYDVVISSSYAVAKGVLTRADQLHICYIHSPARYAWDLYSQYMEHDRRGRGLRGILARIVLHYIRLFDVVSSRRVDTFIANSHNVARRVWKTYRREAHVVYPPVDTEAFSLHHEKQQYYLTVSRLVPYKRVDLIVDAFAHMPEKELLIIGDGPEYKKLQSKAGPNVKMLGYQPFEAMKHYMQRSRGFVFAAEEDFGIVPVEAQACGTPVIAYGKGGVLETVVDGETGVFFEEQTTECLIDAIKAFEALPIDYHEVRLNAERFSRARFRTEMDRLIREEMSEFAVV